MSIRDINNTEHYNWGEACDGWHLLKTDSLSVIQEKCQQAQKNPTTIILRHNSFLHSEGNSYF